MRKSEKLSKTKGKATNIYSFINFLRSKKRIVKICKNDSMHFAFVLDQFG